MTKLPKTWKVKTLGEVCEILDNMRKPINSNEREKRLENSDTKYPYYGATGQVGFIDSYLCDFEAILLGEDGAPFLDLYKTKAYIVSGRYWVNNHAHILKAKESITNNKFVCYFLNIFDYHGYVSGTTRLKLNQSSMKQIKIPLPPLDTQKQIVEILESKFAKIENATNALNLVKKDLVKLKASLLNSAFNGTLLHNNDLQALSHDDTASNLPQDWEIKTLGEIGKIVSGGTPSTKDTSNFDGNIAWITPADLSNYKDKYISKGKRNISEKGLKSSSAKLIPKNSILFSSRAPIGYVAIALNELCTNQGFKNIIPNENINSEYVYYYLLGSKNLAETFASGTTFKEISASNFAKLPIPLPPLKTQKQIVEILKSKFKGIEKLDYFVNDSLDKLSKLKASLLNKAFSGELVC